MKKIALVASIALITLAAQAQNTKYKQTVKKIIKLSTETEFVEIAKMFDTTDGRKPVNPFILDYLWRDLEDKFGEFKTSVTVKTYTVNNKEYIIEELQYDSGFVEIKVGFNPKNDKVTSYLLVKQQTRADRELEKAYKLPSYVQKSAVNSKEVQFGEKPFVMEGELTMPSGLKRKQKVAAVVLVHGSGPGDRDEKMGPLQPFKDIAYGLSSNGIAVLRYDKRTLTHSEACGSDKHFDVNKETVDDALAAANYLRQQKNIDPSRVYILGHSLGGMMLPRIGQSDSALAGLIYMAAPARSLPDVIIEQMDYLSTIEPDKKEAYQKSKEEFIRLKTKWYDSTTKAQYLPFNSPPSYWMDLDNYNQTQIAQKIAQPMLILQGEADYQVRVEDFEIWKKTLKDNKNITFRLYPKLHHNMAAINHEGLSVPNDYKIPANVSEAVINDIIGWINKQ